ncbi:hypothetical protein [Methylocapsa acidiphila]|uniref:hypothetical protein n=1 Tax=Methylocapsa acidiphila TaxID=133552 RepID=UPI00047E539B|nr:hypothetical protein [Methylocapsa acidiphila]
MTAVRPAASLEEIIIALAGGQASRQLQKDAAYVIPDLWRGRLPRGVAFNRRGRPAGELPWYSKEKYERPEIDEGWPSEDLVAELSIGETSAETQRLAAYRMIDAIHEFRIHLLRGKRLYQRAGDLIKKPSLWGAYEGVLFIADELFTQGHRKPIEAAMVEAADFDKCGIDRIRRDCASGFAEMLGPAEAFADSVDGLLATHSILDALVIASKKTRFNCWTPFMLRILYRRVREGRAG